MTWKQKWIWRRNVSIMVLAFVGVQWMFSLWIYPLTSSSTFHAPKPRPIAIALVSYSNETISSNTDNQRNISNVQNSVIFLHAKQQTLCDNKTLKMDGLCNNSEEDKEPQMQIIIDNSIDLRKSNQLIYKTQDKNDGGTLESLRLENRIKDGNETNPVREDLPFENDVKTDINNDQELNGQQKDISVSSYINDEDIKKDNFESWKMIMEERKQLVKEICSQYPTILKRFMNHNRLLFDTKHHIAYCRNAKAGTTSWLSNLLENTGVNLADMTTEEIHEAAKINFPLLHPKLAAEEMNHPALLFTVVRHPFTRLVSAYRDKIPENYRMDLQLQMIDKYRYETNKQPQAYEDDTTILDPSMPTFREFALFVSDQILACIPVVNSACLEQIDSHWRPYYDRCAPCDLHYDVIAKVETFQDDAKYIKQLTGLPVEFKTDKHGGSSLIHASTGPSSTNLSKIYFSQLTRAERQKIYDAYFFDFELFGYSPYIIN